MHRGPIIALAVGTLLTALAVPGGASTTPGGHFTDDNGSTHEGYIEAVADAGIANGCTATTYCPSNAVTRAQMASFLARGYDLPTTRTDHFSDDEGGPHEANIDRVAAAGIASGTGPRRYSPGSTVTRGQMASFLARAGVLPPASRDYFSDDNGSAHEDNTNRIAAAGIATGTGGGAYNPSAPVSRAQMATFLGRALGLAPRLPRPPGTETGRVAFDHPTWGAATLISTATYPHDRGGFLYVVDAVGDVRWSYAVTEVDADSISVHQPGKDALGHLFVDVNSGRYNSVMVLRPVPGGFKDFSTLPPPGDYSERFYSGEAVDTDGDGRFEIVVYTNDCVPDCAGGTVTATTYSWNGSDYALIGPATGLVVLGLGGTFDDLTVYTDEQTAVDHLVSRLGPPTSDDPDWWCSPFFEEPGRTIGWGPLHVYIRDAHADASEYEPTEGSYVTGWSYSLATGQVDDLGLQTAEGIGLGSSLSELKAAYPDGYETTYYGDIRAFTVFRGDVSNIDFMLYDADRVDSMYSGAWCPE